mgnify:CR=1 FL=1
MMFNFPVNQTMFYAMASGDTGPLKEIPLTAAVGIGPPCCGLAGW